MAQRVLLCLEVLQFVGDVPGDLQRPAVGIDDEDECVGVAGRGLVELLQDLLLA